MTTYDPQHSTTVWRREPARLSPEQIRISVIIPTLQEEKSLPRLLSLFDDASINCYGIELIVSDGGSTDSTVDIARAFADVVIVHSSQRRQTIAEGRNVGAQIAQGQTLVFLNADCIPAQWEQFWQTIAEWAAEYGPYASYAVLAAPVLVHPLERQWSDRIVHACFNAYLQLAARMGLGVGRGECHAVRRWLFERTGGYTSSLAAGEDFEFLHRARKWTHVAIPHELCVYESPRRYRRLGYLRILSQWFLNWISALIARRSHSAEWTPVRD